MHILSLYQETPRPLSAMIGLACVVLARELTAVEAGHPMAEGAISQYGFTIAACLIIALALIYRRRPDFRISRQRGLVITASVVTALSMSLLFGGDAASSPWHEAVLFALYQSGAAILIVIWFETILSLGSRRVGLVFLGSVLFYALMNAALLLIRQDIMFLIDIILPLASGGLLLYRQGREASGEGEEADAAGNRTFSQNHLMAMPRGQKVSASFSLRLSFLILAMLFCCRFAFGFANGEWLHLQNSPDFSLGTQLSNLGGTLVAALFLVLMLEKCWNQSSAILMASALTAALLGCLLCSAISMPKSAMCGLARLAFGQKIILRLALLSPFILDARNPPITLCIAMAVAMAALGLFLMASAALGGTLLAVLAGIAVLIQVVLQLLLVIVLTGNSSETAENVERRISASSFNGAASPSLVPALERNNTQAAIAVAEQCGLTQRETEVLLLLANRYNAQAVAELLVISEATAKTHMRKIYAKLGVHTQKELIASIEMH